LDAAFIPKCKANAVHLHLHAVACNLANLMRTLTVPYTLSDRSLTALREKLLKIAAEVARRGRYLTFQLAEVAVPGAQFAESCNA